MTFPSIHVWLSFHVPKLLALLKSYVQQVGLPTPRKEVLFLRNVGKVSIAVDPYF